MAAKRRYKSPADNPPAFEFAFYPSAILLYNRPKRWHNLSHGAAEPRWVVECCRKKTTSRRKEQEHEQEKEEE